MIAVKCPFFISKACVFFMIIEDHICPVQTHCEGVVVSSLIMLALFPLYLV